MYLPIYVATRSYMFGLLDFHWLLVFVYNKAFPHAFYMVIRPSRILVTYLKLMDA